MLNEKRLIKADWLTNSIADYVLTNAYLNDTALDALKMVANWVRHAPSVDAVLVVRCRDCKHWCDSWVAPDGKHEHGYCHMEESDDVIVGRWDDDFCSYGERRTTND